MAEQFPSLPTYDRPPVVETVLGVQFDPLPGYKSVHPGKFLATLDPEEWASVSDVPPLPPQHERFGDAVQWGGSIGMMFGTPLFVRTQFKNIANDRMIQIQNGRLIYNWMAGDDKPYPRYSDVRAGFLAAWTHFKEFVHAERIGPLRPNQWEVTYLNHVPMGTVWNNAREWSFLKLIGSNSTLDGIAEAENFEGEWHFVLPEKRGRLHVSWAHGRKLEPNGQPLIIVTLTARGPIESDGNDMLDVSNGLDFGHDVIVRSFEKLMSPEANTYWGLRK